MKARLARVKKYLSDHRAPIAYGAGVVAGAVPTAYILSKKFATPDFIHVLIDMTPEELAKMFEETGAVELLDVSAMRMIVVESLAAQQGE